MVHLVDGLLVSGGETVVQQLGHYGSLANLEDSKSKSIVSERILVGLWGKEASYSLPVRLRYSDTVSVKVSLIDGH